MNGKQAKRLRKSREIKVLFGLPEVETDVRIVPGKIWNPVLGSMSYEGLDESGNVVPVFRKLVTLSPACKRSKYNELKRKFKKGEK